MFQHQVQLFFFLFFIMVQQLGIQEQYVEYYYVKYRFIFMIEKKFFFLLKFCLANSKNFSYSIWWITSWCNIIWSYLFITISSIIGKKYWCLECKKFYCFTSFTIEYYSLYSIEFKYKMFFTTTINKWNWRRRWNIKSKVRRILSNDIKYRIYFLVLILNIQLILENIGIHY